jgi:transposase-like protein
MGRIKGKFSSKAQLAIAALEKGQSVASVARMLRVSERTVYRWKKSLGVPARENETHATLEKR